MSRAELRAVLAAEKIDGMYGGALSGGSLFRRDRNARPESGKSCEALLLLRDVRERFTLITLDEQEYLETLEDAATAGISGGAIHDAIIARCAVEAKAQAIYTWNVKHFTRLGPRVASRVREP